jgi:hypothetical protein
MNLDGYALIRLTVTSSDPVDADTGSNLFDVVHQELNFGATSRDQGGRIRIRTTLQPTSQVFARTLDEITDRLNEITPVTIRVELFPRFVVER